MRKFRISIVGCAQFERHKTLAHLSNRQRIFGGAKALNPRNL